MLAPSDDRIVCQECQTSTTLPDPFPADGSEIRCSECSTPFFFFHLPAEPGEAFVGPEPPDRSSPFFERFSHKRYTLRPYLWKWVGAALEIYDGGGRLCGFVRKKPFKLKEDVTVYPDRRETRPLLHVRGLKVLDHAGVYEVEDASTREVVGSVRRQWIRSDVWRATWHLSARDGEPVATVEQDASRNFFLGSLFGRSIFPQSYTGRDERRLLFRFQESANVVARRMKLDFHPDTTDRVDLRLGIAVGALLCVLERKPGG